MNQNTQGGLFGSQSNAQQSVSAPNYNNSYSSQPQQPQGSFFGSQYQQPGLGSSVPSQGTAFGTNSQPASSSLFGSTQPQQGQSSAFGANNQSASSSLFGSTQQPQQGFSFSNSSASTQPATVSMFRQSAPVPTPPTRAVTEVNLPPIQPYNAVQMGLNFDAQNSLAVKPYSLSITIETPDNPADLSVKINDSSLFKLSSKTLIESCEFFRRELEGKEQGNWMLEVNIPFPNLVLEFFLWITYKDHLRLVQKINYFHELLEIYSIGKVFKVKPELGLVEILLKSRNINISCMPNIQSMPDVWDRKYIDFKFVKRLLNYPDFIAPSYTFGGGLFGGNVFGGGYPDDGKSVLALDWLGEKSCYTEEDIEALKDSEDFKKIGDELEINGWLPRNTGNYVYLVKRYPVGIRALSGMNILRGFSLA